MYILGVSLFRASPIVFQLKPSKPFLNVTSNHETLHDNLQHGSYIRIYKYKVCFYIHPFWSSIDWLPQTASVSSSSSSQSSGAKAPLVFQEPQRNQNEKSLGSLGKMYQLWYLIVYETKLQLKLDVQTRFCICDHTSGRSPYHLISLTMSNSWDASPRYAMNNQLDKV